MSDIRAVIFDIGGVLTTSPVASVRRFCEREELPYGAVGPLLSAPDGAWSHFEKSELSPAQFVSAFEAECGALGVAMPGTAFLTAFYEAMQARPEMLTVVRQLKDAYRLGCITNNVARGETSHRPIPPLEELFHVVVESAKVGMRKPDPRIYEHTCALLEVTPPECVFLDDFGVNLKGARALGMTTIRVDETLSALDELEHVLGRTLR